MLAGTDIIGDTILEVNVFFPGNLISCIEIAGVNFVAKIRESIERKLEIRDEYAGHSQISDASTGVVDQSRDIDDRNPGVDDAFRDVVDLIEDVANVTGGIGDVTRSIADRSGEVRNRNADIQNGNCVFADATRGLQTNKPPGGGL